MLINEIHSDENAGSEFAGCIASAGKRCWALIKYIREKAILTGFIVSTSVYLFALWLGKYLLIQNNLEFPPFSRWVVLNTFAIALAYIATLPF